MLSKLNGQLWLQAGSGVGVATLTGNRTLTGTSAQFQYLTASGADRSVLLPALGPNGAGQWFVVRNAGASNNLLVKTSDGGTTVVTLAPGDWAWIVSGRIGSSLSWYVAQTTVGLVTLAITGALSAAAATFTGRVTTTDGVTSGDARIVGGNVHTKQSTTTLTNSNVETTLASHPLPANTIKAGTTVRVRGSARVTNGTGSTTLTAKLKVGSTTVYTLGPIDPAANDTINFDFLITGRAAPGAAAEVAVNGAFVYTVGGADSSKSACLAPANYATNGALTLAFTGQWSASDVNSISCESFTVDVVG